MCLTKLRLKPTSSRVYFEHGEFWAASGWSDASLDGYQAGARREPAIKLFTLATIYHRNKPSLSVPGWFSSRFALPANYRLATSPAWVALCVFPLRSMCSVPGS